MNLILLSDSPLRSSDYLTPAIEFFIVEMEETLAKSNIEPIDEDDDEYRWI